MRCFSFYCKATGQTLAVGAITTSGDLTLTKAVSKIEHTGATSFTIESTGTDGTVEIDGVTFDEGAVSGMSSLSVGAITSTGNLAL